MLWNGKCFEVRDIRLQKHGAAHPSFRTAPPNGYLWSVFQIMSRLRKRRNSSCIHLQTQMPSKMPGIEKSCFTRWVNEKGKAINVWGKWYNYKASAHPNAHSRFAPCAPNIPWLQKESPGRQLAVASVNHQVPWWLLTRHSTKPSEFLLKLIF